MAIAPFEANAPLVVDPNAVLTGAVSAQSFQSIGRRHAQILQGLRPVEHSQLAQGNLLNVGRQPARPLPLKDLLCFCVLETLDHAGSV